jgi:hypothetical protein
LLKFSPDPPKKIESVPLDDASVIASFSLQFVKLVEDDDEWQSMQKNELAK